VMAVTWFGQILCTTQG